MKRASLILVTTSLLSACGGGSSGGGGEEGGPEIIDQETVDEIVETTTNLVVDEPDPVINVQDGLWVQERTTPIATSNRQFLVSDTDAGFEIKKCKESSPLYSIDTSDLPTPEDINKSWNDFDGYTYDCGLIGTIESISDSEFVINCTVPEETHRYELVSNTPSFVDGSIQITWPDGNSLNQRSDICLDHEYDHPNYDYTINIHDNDKSSTVIITLSNEISSGSYSYDSSETMITNIKSDEFYIWWNDTTGSLFTISSGVMDITVDSDDLITGSLTLTDFRGDIVTMAFSVKLI